MLFLIATMPPSADAMPVTVEAIARLSPQDSSLEVKPLLQNGRSTIEVPQPLGHVLPINNHSSERRSLCCSELATIICVSVIMLISGSILVFASLPLLPNSEPTPAGNTSNISNAF